MFNRSVDVYWSPIGGREVTDAINNKPAVDILWYEPEPVLKHVVQERDKYVSFLKCPGFQDMYRNTYMVRSPMDVSFSIVKDDKGNCIIREHLNSPQFFNDFVTHRDAAQNSRFPMISLSFGYLLYSNKPVDVEVMPPTLSMHVSDGLKDINLICGKFDISKWIRPLEFAFEIHDGVERINIKRGDPLYYFRLNTEKKINLIRKELDETALDLMTSCLVVKQYVQGNSMEQNYRLAEPLLKLHRDKLFKKKCPFGFGK